MSLQALQIGSPLHTKDSRFNIAEDQPREDNDAVSYKVEEALMLAGRRGDPPNAVS